MARALASGVRDWRTAEGMGRRALMRDSKMARRSEGVRSVGWSRAKGRARAARRALRDGRRVGGSGRGRGDSESVDIVRRDGQECLVAAAVDDEDGQWRCSCERQSRVN